MNEQSQKMNDKFKIYLKLLSEYNEKVNLVSSTEADTVINKHFKDSLAIGMLQDIIDFSTPLSLVDIGIGGGFPGMPIIIEYQNLKLCAVDSVGKKLEFLKLLSNELGLSNRVEIVNSRAEDLIKQQGRREAFDIAVTRAVARLNVICEYCLPFVKIGGYFIAYKAKTAQEELKEADFAVKELGGEAIKVVPYTITGEEERNLVVIKKVKATPAKYPRKTGIPSKTPLFPKKT